VSAVSAPRIRRKVVLDGLLGIGAKGPLREPVRAAAREINEFRDQLNTYVFSADVPTGVDADTGEADADAVRADFTLCVGLVKAGVLADAATNQVGRLTVLPLDELPAPPGRGELITPWSLDGVIKRRNFDSHKGEFGRVGIVAGSRGFAGAAVMSATAALRAGAGLVTLFVLREIYEIVAMQVPPEVMVAPLEKLTDVRSHRLDVLAIGPGLGLERTAEILELIETLEIPMVVDADALNALSTRIEILTKCAGPRLLTPHPGEMARLMPQRPATRLQTVQEFTARYPVTLLLKGARTIIGERGREAAYNSTGNPGMAGGGMGDVLTGVCAALLGQQKSPFDTARLGAWLCGRAAEIALFENGRSEESLAAMDLPTYFGAAFRDLRMQCF
jgi:NAD(P)H-hydrate epimerase